MKCVGVEKVRKKDRREWKYSVFDIKEEEKELLLGTGRWTKRML
jgi:hypothetical protein